MANENKTFTLTLDVQKINIILGSLQEMPFKLVQPVLADIEKQLMAQQQAEAPELPKA